MVPALIVLALRSQSVEVSDTDQLARALKAAKPGTTVLLAPGRYKSGLHAEGVHGSPELPITVRSKDRDNPATFVGGNTGLQFSRVSHLTIRDLVIEDCASNGLNIDDGGQYGKPSHHVTLVNVVVRRLPAGNHDGIKLSGLDNFQVLECRVENWGGSAVDMVGCHGGWIHSCTFVGGGDSGVQMKGGSSKVSVSHNTFSDAGLRAVNAGGSTGTEYFRPPVAQMPAASKYEAKEVSVTYNVFQGAQAAVAFVGVDGCKVENNTIYVPGKWAFRILQENREPGFVPCRNGVVGKNLVVFKSEAWGEGGTNIGPGTDAGSFRYSQNFWYCLDSPARSNPRLPTQETGGVYGKDPLFENGPAGDFRLRAGSPAKGFGANP